MSSKRARVEPHAAAPPGGDAASHAAFHEAQYFGAYADLAVHAEMLRDSTRTLAYQAALEAARLPGKTVLDVGSGTCVLSIFAARAGAAHVYAVEASALAEQARRIVAENGLSDVITVLQGRVEEVELPVAQVDVIVSEWMGACWRLDASESHAPTGYALFYEHMLPSVLRARDRWLRPGGAMLPSHATLWAAPVADEERVAEATAMWDDQYGIDMSSLAPLALRCAFSAPVVDSLSPDVLLSWPVPLRRIDCRAIDAAEILPWASGPFSARCMGSGACTGLALWFDVEFGAREGEGPPLGRAGPVPPPPEGVIRLSTGPEDAATHWMTTSLVLDEPLSVRQDEEVVGTLSIESHASNSRFLHLSLSLAVAPGEGGESCGERRKEFDML